MVVTLCLVSPFLLFGDQCYIGPLVPIAGEHWGGRGWGAFPGKRDRMAADALFWAGCDPSRLKGSLWAARRDECELGVCWVTACEFWLPSGWGKVLPGSLSRSPSWMEVAVFPFMPNLGVSSVGWNFALRHFIHHTTEICLSRQSAALPSNLHNNL